MITLPAMVVLVVVEGMVVIIVAALAAKHVKAGSRDVRVEAAVEEAREQVVTDMRDVGEVVVEQRRRRIGREMRRISRVMRSGGGEDDRLIDRWPKTKVSRVRWKGRRRVRYGTYIAVVIQGFAGRKGMYT